MRRFTKQVPEKASHGFPTETLRQKQEAKQAKRGRSHASLLETVRNLTGQILLDQAVGHIFQIRDGNVVRFDIRGAANP